MLVEQPILETTSKCIKDKMTIGNSQHGFTIEESCLRSLTAFYDAITSLLDEGSAVDALYLNFNKAFATVSHKILINKLIEYTLDKRTLR